MNEGNVLKLIIEAREQTLKELCEKVELLSAAIPKLRAELEADIKELNGQS